MQMRCGILGPAKRVGGTPNPKFIFVLNPKSAMLDFLDFDFFFGKVFLFRLAAILDREGFFSKAAILDREGFFSKTAILVFSKGLRVTLSRSLCVT